MPDQRSTTEERPPPLWQYVRLEDYARPAEPATEVVRKGLRGLWGRLRGEAAAEVLVDPAALSEVNPEVLDRVAPEADWAEPVAALDEALADWPEAEAAAAAMQVVVGAPHGGHPEVLARWARAHAWRVFEAPSPEDLLGGGEGWLARLADDPEAPLVIPRLERCYLRHHHGLDLLRRLLDLLWDSGRRCLLGCDLWAWTYLSKAIQIDTLVPPPRVLQAFDARRLERWFAALARRADGQAVAFRQADSGAFVLPHAAPESASGEQQAEAAGFLKHLAGYSHGNPGVARIIWKKSLRDRPEEATHDAPSRAAEAERTVWVKPWSDLAFPAVPDAGARSLLLVVHALLLHGGLPAPLLASMLPLPPGEVMRSLHRLEAARLVEEDAQRWQVTPLGYPAAARFIKSEGFLTPAW